MFSWDLSLSGFKNTRRSPLKIDLPLKPNCRYEAVGNFVGDILVSFGEQAPPAVRKTSGGVASHHACILSYEFLFEALRPARWPVEKAAWRLNPPVSPVMSRISPAK